MENNVRIIQLGPVDSVSQAYSFEDAFGEYSEARGRAERKKRKLKRIADKREVKAARQEAKRERQQGRIANRTTAQQARVQKRTAATEARQQKRSLASQARQERKIGRKEARVFRRNIGREQDFVQPEQDLETGAVVETGYETTPPVQPQVESSDSYQESVQEETQVPSDNSGVYDANYGSAESAYDYGNEEQGSDELAYEEPIYEDEYSDSEDYLADYDSEMPFDGITASDNVTEFTDGNIDPKVQDAVNKLVWNKELISRLENKRNTVGGDQKQEISKKIIERKKRVNELKSQLDGYCNVEGDFYGADGQVVSNKRRNEIQKAHRIALSSRKRLQKPQVTPVDSELNPRIGQNTIVIPASSDFTGLNALDLQNDYDAPGAREFMLGADGSKSSKISWTSVAIGIVVGAAAIWAIKKYKLIK
jgi:hypothetical protein